MRCGIPRKNDSERSVQNGKSDPNLTPVLITNTRIRPRQELRGLPGGNTVEVHHLARQLILVDDPGIPDIHKRSQRHGSSHNRDSILHVQNALSIAADIHDIVKGRRNLVSRFRVQLLNGSRKKGYSDPGTGSRIREYRNRLPERTAHRKARTFRQIPRHVRASKRTAITF